jgi:hypothetical protein
MNPQLLEQLVQQHAQQRMPWINQRQFWMWSVMGLIGSTALLLMIGLRQDLLLATGSNIFWIKIGFPSVLTGLAAFAWWLSLHPGYRFKLACTMAAVCVGVYWMTSLVVVWPADSNTWDAQLWGNTWLECMGYIAFLSIPMVVCLLWITRRYGVLHPVWSGFLCGLAAGTSAATLYSLHCREPGLLFLGSWYLLGALIPAILGAVVSPALLAWRK